MIGTRFKCPHCSLIWGVLKEPVFAGDIVRARHFSFHPEFPSYGDGEKLHCRKCEGNLAHPFSKKMCLLTSDDMEFPRGL